MKHLFALTLCGVLLAGCDAGRPAAPSPDFGFVPDQAPPAGFTVMTRNLYIGADVDAVIAALATPDPGDDLPALLAALAVLQRTDFPARAAGLADEIARARPHAVGLQEVDRLEVDLTPLGLPLVLSQDMLPALLAALAARGLRYAVAGAVTNIRAAPVPGVSLTDQDVMLVDADRVAVAAVTARTFAANLGTVAPGVELVRGFVMIDATVAGLPVRIATTHLESGSGPGLAALRAAQAQELVAAVGDATPAVLLGDFNDTPAAPLHAVIAAAGFRDAWAALRPGAPGFTCCEAADLSNRVAALDQRIDYVFARGLGGPAGPLAGRIAIVGDRPGDRVPGPAYPLWPSDHAGVVLDVLLPPAARPRP